MRAERAKIILHEIGIIFKGIISTYQCSCSSLDYELSDQSLRLFGVPSEFVTQQTSESRRRCGYKIYIANESRREEEEEEEERPRERRGKI